MAYFDKTEYAKYVSLQNVSASGDPADAPQGGVYLYASGTAADPNEAHLWLRNAGGAPIDLAEGGTLQMAGDSGTDSVDMANDTLTFAGGDGLTSAVSDNQVSFSLNANSTSFQIASDEIQLASAVAGDGLSLSSHALSVNVAGGLEIDTDNVQIADSGVSTAKIADSAVTTAKIADVNVTTGKLADDAVTGAKIAADAVDSEHIALGALDSEHYATGSIESNHLKGSVANDKLANSSVTVTAGDGLKDGGAVALGASVTLNIEPADFAGNGLEDDGSDNLRIAIDGIAASFAAATVQDADMFAVHDAAADVLKSVTMEYLRDSMFGAVSGDAAIAAGGALTISNGSVETDMLADSAVTSAKIADYTIVSADMATGTLINRNYGSGSIEGGHIGSDEIDSQHYAAGSIDNEHIADATIANAKLVNDSVTLTAGAGMAALGEVDLGASITVAVDGVLEDLDTLGAPSADGEFIVATGAGAFAYESGDTARTSLGLGTGDSPAFASLEVSDLTEGRIVLAGASGELEDSASLRFTSGLLDVTASAGISLNGSVNFANGYLFNSSYGMSFDSSTGQFVARGLGSFDGGVTALGGFGGGSGVSLAANGSGGAQFATNLTVNKSDGTLDNDVKFYGSSNAGARFEWDAGDERIKMHNGTDQVLEMGSTAGGYAIEVAQLAGDAGKIKATAFVTYSDESLKSDIVAMDTALDTIMSLKGVEFTWKNSGERDFGFIAQEVAQVVPQAVSTGNDGISGVDYSRLTSILVEAVKSQQVQIEELKAILKK